MPNDRRHGFVLIEAMVVLLVIGVTSAAALALYGAHARAAARVPRLVIATELAREQLTVLRLLKVPPATRLPDSLARGTFAPPFDEYRWSADIEHGDEPALQEIRVEVEWRGGSYALATRASEPPVALPRGSSP